MEKQRSADVLRLCQQPAQPVYLQSRKFARTCATDAVLYQQEHTSHPAPPLWGQGQTSKRRREERGAGEAAVDKNAVGDE
jgi:hypothetical protein